MANFCFQFKQRYFMTKKERAATAVQLLKKEYPDAICSLNYADPLQLLIAVRLSAQCTDARVNQVTPALFERFNSLESFCEAEYEEVGKYIYSCGFYNTKSKDIVEMCRMIRDDFSGEVPDNIDDLTKLPGVGRKTANLLVGDLYGKHAVVCDTHFIRIMRRLGFTDTDDPLKTEKTMRPLLEVRDMET